MFGIQKVENCNKCPVKEDSDLKLALKQREINDLKNILLTSEGDLNLLKQENTYLKEAFKKFGIETTRQKVVDFICGLELTEKRTCKIIPGDWPGGSSSILPRSEYVCKPIDQNT